MDLNPETIRTYELVFEQYAGQHDRFNVSVYYYDVGRLVTQLTSSDRDLYFENLSRVTANGIELEWERKYEHGLLARASYALQRTEDAETHHVLTSSPRQLAKVNIGVPLGARIDAGFELQYHGSTETLAGARADDFVVGNLSVSGQLARPGLRLSASVYNIFDTRYGYPGAGDHLQDVIEQDGRTVRLNVHYKF
jgi:iron complex outermembrane receptor protein